LLGVRRSIKLGKIAIWLLRESIKGDRLMTNFLFFPVCSKSVQSESIKSFDEVPRNLRDISPHPLNLGWEAVYPTIAEIVVGSAGKLLGWQAGCWGGRQEPALRKLTGASRMNR
jgi:hypothetical protein